MLLALYVSSKLIALGYHSCPVIQSPIVWLSQTVAMMATGHIHPTTGIPAITQSCHGDYRNTGCSRSSKTAK